jgi:hypothetical protein
MSNVIHSYSLEQVTFLKENVYGRSRKEITVMFNACFGLELRESQITGFIKNRHLKTGLDGRFSRGHIPFNKDKKGIGGWDPTQFKKGNKPANWVPIGSERVNGDGYVDIKIADGKLQKNWKGKHIIIWEKANGLVPEGSVLIFADRNRLNVTLENLLLVSRSELAIMNRRGLITSNSELTKTGIIVADIHLKIGERKKK